MGACMGAQKLVLSDSLDKPPGLPMQGSWAGLGDMASLLAANSYFVSQNLQTKPELCINIHMYDHLGVSMGAWKLMLTDSPDEPPGSHMKHSWAVVTWLVSALPSSAMNFTLQKSYSYHCLLVFGQLFKGFLCTQLLECKAYKILSFKLRIEVVAMCRAL